MKEVLKELGFWVSVFCSAVYMVAFYVRWAQTYKTSTAHYWVGKFAAFTATVFFIVFTFANPYAYPFGIVAAFGTAIWVGFNDWFFWRYPIPAECLQVIAKEREGTKIHKPRWKFIERVLAPPEDRPQLFGLRFKLISAGILFFLLAIFAFGRKLDSIAESEKKVAQEREATTQAVTSMTATVNESIQKVADTLQAGQQIIVAAVDSTNREIEAVKAKTGQLEKAIDTKANKTTKVKTNGKIKPSVPPTPVKPTPVKLPVKTSFWDWFHVKVDYPTPSVDSVEVHFASGRQHLDNY